MIKVDEGNVSMSGSVPQLLTDLTVIVKALRETKTITDEMINTAVDLSKMTEEELLEKTKDTVMQKLLELKMLLDDKDKKGDK